MKAKPKNPAARLRALMREHSLTNAKVAELSGVSVKTVESWLASPKAASFRSMPDRQLRIFEIFLASWLKLQAEID